MNACPNSAEAFRSEQRARSAHEKLALQRLLRTQNLLMRATSGKPRPHLAALLLRRRISVLSREDAIAFAMAQKYASIRMAESVASVAAKDAKKVADEILKWHPTRLFETLGPELGSYANKMHTSVVRQRVRPGDRTSASLDANKDRLRGVTHLLNNPEWTIHDYAHHHARSEHFYTIKNHLGKRRNERLSPSGIFRWFREWGSLPENKDVHAGLKARATKKRSRR